MVSRVTVEVLMPILSDFEPRQLNRRLSNLHVEFMGENGSDWSGHCCDRTRVFGKNSGRGEAWYVRDDVTRREFHRPFDCPPLDGRLVRADLRGVADDVAAEIFVDAAHGADAHFMAPVCTENLIRVDDVMESPKLAE